MPRCVYGGMKTVFAAAFVVTLLAAELVPVLAGEGDPPGSPGAVLGNPATSVTTMPDEIDSRETTIPEPPRVDPSEATVPGTTIPEPPPAEPTTTTAEPPNVETAIDGPPLVVNGEAISPDLICAGVDGAVIFVDEGTRYIAGFEDGSFLRVILSDGMVLETNEVSLDEDRSGAYAKGILHGEFPEASITMYLDDDLAECPSDEGKGDVTSPSSPLIVNGDALTRELVWDSQRPRPAADTGEKRAVAARAFYQFSELICPGVSW